MVCIRFVQADKTEQMVEIATGISMMEGAVKAGVDGIDADCGGAVSCATCHVHVAPDWMDKLPEPAADEREMLEFAVGADATSRLSCQIIANDDLAGLKLHVPATQR